MDRKAKSAVHDLVLSLRETLEGEIERALAGYGIRAEGAWTPADEVHRLTDEERDVHRPRIEVTINREQTAGLDQAEAVEAFIRETAYTHMNRLLGLKCLEVRDLIDETITTRLIYSGRSKRHRDYLDEHPRAHRAPDRGLITMLQAAYAEVSQHIGVVFDPESEYSILWPRHAKLKDCIAEINALDAEVAQALDRDPETVPNVYADDTILGWVYQYFQEEEKDRVFRELRTKKQKISGYDIVPATTIYTEHYMVQFLVENSLGALWMEMYPDSELCENWDYFVEDPNLQNDDGTRRRGRDVQPVATLSQLDPAVGSGHFLLYAFDLFAQMYEAEARRAGERVDRLAIARRILRENLHGIDIDERAIQIAALNLYMKACTYAGVRLAGLRNGELLQMNLVCANIVLRKGPELDDLLACFKNDPWTQELIETLWEGLQNAREMGSLLKVDEQIDALIARKREAEKGTFWEHPEDLWDQWKRDFLTTLKTYVDRAAESFDVNRRMFGQEAIKGVQLLDLMTQRYDVVTTNPPYMYNRNMGNTIRSFVKQAYPDSRSDLYTCFVSRGIELTLRSGFLAMISQQSFMFISSYQDLRETLLKSTSVRSMAHLGPGAFEDIGGEVVNTTMYVLRASVPEDWKASFIRIFEKPNKKSALIELDDNKRSSQMFMINQSRFLVIEGSPISYWVPSKVFDLFESLPKLEQFASAVTGMQTGKNARFIRYWWEPSKGYRNSRWKTYAKGGPYQKYYGNLYWVIDWGSDGSRVRNYEGSTIRNEEFHFREGVTYSDIASTGFNARILPKGSLFDLTGHSVFSDHYSPSYLLALLNSKLVNYFLNILNPTFHFQVGNVSSLPFAIPNEQEKRVLSQLTDLCINTKLRLQSISPVEKDFETSGIERVLQSMKGNNKIDLRGIYLALLDLREMYEVRVLLCAGIIDNLIFDLYDIGLKTQLEVVENQGLPTSKYPLLSSTDSGTDIFSILEETGCKYTPSSISYKEWIAGDSAFSSGDPESVRKHIDSEIYRLYVDENLSLKEICVELGLNPISIVSLRREMGLINPDDLKHEVENFLTHRIWELCKREGNAIIPYDKGLRTPPLLEQVQSEIEAVFGAEHAVAIEAEMDEILGRGGLAGWLENPFFKKHKSQFNRRPILWQITSPDKHFRVLVYYHKLDHDTLPSVRSHYLWPLLERAQTQLRIERDEDEPDVKAIGDLEAYIADLQACDRQLERVIQGDLDVDLPDWAIGPYRNGQPPYNPDLDDGVKINLLPLQAAEILPYKKVV